ncbi:hypothetical protein [Streptomyces sp. NPDC051183]|uniref:hypothetical protein n=1 Tax=Streptomyces sp. NPDC051183 TaxID=3155165 RepID=UPI0034214E61
MRITPELYSPPMTCTARMATGAWPRQGGRRGVSDPHGVLATLTTGARTVTVRGPQRHFTEQKRPFTDPFDRVVKNLGGEKPEDGDPEGWGPSPGGGRWDIDGYEPLHSDYTVEGGSGRIKLARDNRTRYAYLVDKEVGDVDVTAVVGFSKAPSGAPLSIGLTCGFTDMKNHYRARITVSPAPNVEVRLFLEKEDNDVVTVLGGTPQSDSVLLATGFTPSDRWNIRLVREGHKLRASAWRSGDAESTAKSSGEVTDTRFGKGHIGVRALASLNSTNLPVDAIVDEFKVNSCSWAEPPSVTHATWVRLLPAPFNGTWTKELDAQIRAWASDISPDALSFASMFLLNAPDVTSPALHGARVLGKASYGPREHDAPDSGRLDIGADVFDYMGLKEAVFPNGEPDRKPGEDPEDRSRFKGSLDCSGFVRMVFGYHMGIPMVVKRDFGSGNLPRTSHDMALEGPGVIVAQSTPPAGSQDSTAYEAKPPSITGLQIGDTLYFNCEPEKAGAPADQRRPIDHVGIYVGLDDKKRPRFVSSRKTPDGPTRGDLAAQSLIGQAGTGYYTKALRIIRRF